MTPWIQNYDPFGNPFLSTLLAASPVMLLMTLLLTGRTSVHTAAFASLCAAMVVADLGFRMPPPAVAFSAINGALFALLPVCWMIVNLLFLYQLTLEKGWFNELRRFFMIHAPDPRIQLILVAFCFGAFFEGIAGFGAPVAVTAALLIQLKFRPLDACVYALLANTAPVAFGSLGIPIVTLARVTGLDELSLSQMAGRQLPVFSAIIPAWIIVVHSGWKGLREVWPAALVSGGTFAVMQALMANLHGPVLVDIVSALTATGATVLLLRYWSPGDAPRLSPDDLGIERDPNPRAWIPWIVLVVCVFIGSQKPVKDALDSLFAVDIHVPFADNAVQRGPAIVPQGAVAKPEPAVWRFNPLSTTGTFILIAALLSGWYMRYPLWKMRRIWWNTLDRLVPSLWCIVCMISLGFVTKASGADAIMGLALAQTGWLYPFFGTLLGWLGVALTGSDTASNVLFGSLQTITAQQVGVSPVLMASANSVGGVMGKMIDAQSIVVASTAADIYGDERFILRRVIWHSLALACLVGLWVFLQAYVWPFTEMVVEAK